MNWQDIDLMPILAGLGLFLFGMYTLEEALRGLAGRSFKKIMQQYTNNPLLAILVGITMTVLVQSSSMVSLLVMSFVGAGVIGLRNGICVILGANIGTTATTWIITFIGFKVDLTGFIMPVLAVGGLAILFSKSEKMLQLSKLLMGFSFIFLGLTYMKNGFVEFAAQIDISIMHDRHPLFFVSIGLLLSATIQASSATMMILMASLSAGLITLHDSFYVVLGSDVGTTMTAVIGTLNGNSVRKKVGWAHVFFNIFNTLIVFPFVWLFEYFILDILRIEDNFLALALFHTLFNIIGVIAILPFIQQFTWFINKIVRTKENKIAKHIMLAEPKESHSAISALENECAAFVLQSVQVNQSFFQSGSGHFHATYLQLKAYESEIVDFYMKLQQGVLRSEEAQHINHLAASVRNATLSAKSIKDLKPDFDELSSTAADNLYALHEKLIAHQTIFYQELHTCIQQKNQSNELERIHSLQKEHYKEETQYVMQLFMAQTQNEMDMPTLQNMLRQLSSSNESLLRAIRFLLVEDKLLATEE